MTEGNQDIASQIRSIVQHGSTHIVMGAVFALPGFLLVLVLSLGRAEQGYYLIAMAFMTANVALRTLSDTSEDDNEDLPELKGTDAIIFILLMLLGTIISVSTRLLLGVVAAMVASTFISQGLTVLLIAGIVPILDYKLTGVSIWLSIPSAISTIIMRIVGGIIMYIRSDSSLVQELLGDPRQFTRV